MNIGLTTYLTNQWIRIFGHGGMGQQKKVDGNLPVHSKVSAMLKFSMRSSNSGVRVGEVL